MNSPSWPQVDVRRTEIDGVRVLWMPDSASFGAQLQFRVGMWDEPLRLRGITHLIEHLTLNPLRKTEHPFGGAVQGDQTTFWAQGEPERVAEFLERVCVGLSEGSAASIDHEAKVLAAEDRGRPRTAFDALTTLLFGPNGPGVVDYAELALDWVEEDDVRAWRSQWFTRENAVLCVQGEPPAALRLPLASGRSRPYELPPQAFGQRFERPTNVAFQEAGVSWAGLGERSRGLTQSASMLQERLMDRLRHELGLVYSASCNYVRLDRQRALLLAGTDCDPKHARRVSEEFVGILSAFAESGPSEDEMARMRRMSVQAAQAEPESFRLSELFREARSLLLEHEHESMDAHWQRTHALDAETLRADFAACFRTSIAIAPEGTPGLETMQAIDDGPLPGTSFRIRVPSAGFDELRVGSEGLAGRFHGRWSHLLWKDLVLCHRVRADVLQLYSRTGTGMLLGIQDWKRSKQLRRALDEHLPRERIVESKRQVLASALLPESDRTYVDGDGLFETLGRWWRRVFGG